MAINSKTGTTLSIYEAYSSQIVQRSVTLDDSYAFDSCAIAGTSPIEVYVLTSLSGESKLYAISIGSPVNSNQPTIYEIETDDPFKYVSTNSNGEVVAASTSNLTSLAANSGNLTDLTGDWQRSYADIAG